MFIPWSCDVEPGLVIREGDIRFAKKRAKGYK
jgi:hypothetical protein